MGHCATPRSADANAATSRTQVAGLDTCGVDNVIHDPDETEGFIASALSDIHDPVDPADDHPIFSGYADALGMGSEEILACVDQVNPRSPMNFLMEFKDRNLSIREDLWETARNCGFDIDEHPPSNVTGLRNRFGGVGRPVGLWDSGTRARPACSRSS